MCFLIAAQSWKLCPQVQTSNAAWSRKQRSLTWIKMALPFGVEIESPTFRLCKMAWFKQIFTTNSVSFVNVATCIPLPVPSNTMKQGQEGLRPKRSGMHDMPLTFHYLHSTANWLALLPSTATRTLLFAASPLPATSIFDVIVLVQAVLIEFLAKEDRAPPHNRSLFCEWLQKMIDRYRTSRFPAKGQWSSSSDLWLIQLWPLASRGKS